MTLWGTTTRDVSKPAWMTQAEKDELFATDRGWERKIPGGQKATAQVNFTGQPSNDDTIVVGATTYTYKTSLTPAANEVLIGSSATTARDNLAHAINTTGASGTAYGAATVKNATVVANPIAGGNNLKLTVKNGGRSGNSTVLTDGLDNATIAKTFSGGTDVSEIVVSIGQLRSSLTGVESYTIDAAGSSYLVGEKVTVIGRKENAVGEVATIGGSGEVTSIVPLKFGAGFNSADTYDEANGKVTIETAGGSGLQVTANLSGPRLSNLSVNDPNNDSTFVAADVLELTLEYDEPVFWNDGGADPKFVLDFTGCAPTFQADCVLSSPKAETADDTYVFSYTVGAAPTKASAQFTAAGQPSDAETVIINSTTYVMKTTLGSGPMIANQVLIGSNFDDSIQNLVYAINNDPATSGIKYAANTPYNTDVTAAVNGSDPSIMDVTAIKAGTTANSWSTAGTWDDDSDAAWDGTTMNSGTPGTQGAYARAEASARALLTMRTNPTADDTVTIDSHVYTFKASVTTVANQVKIGASASDSIDNLVAAINLATGSGTVYGSATVAHATVSAAAGAGDTMVVTAKTAGTAGNSLGVSETLTDGDDSWNDSSLALGRAAELAINGTSVVLGGGTLHAVGGTPSISGNSATAGAITNIAFVAGAGTPSTVTLTGTTWTDDVIVGNKIQFSNAEDTTNNGLTTITKVTSTTVIEVDKVMTTNAEDTTVTARVFGIQDTAINADVDLTNAGTTKVAASKALTFTDAPSADDTVTIKDLLDNSYVYTFKTAITDTDSPAATEVWVKRESGNATQQAKNLVDAINGEDRYEGVKFSYGSAMEHPDVSATHAAGVVTVTAKVSGTGGNRIVLAESADNTSWAGGAVLLSGGDDASGNLKTGLSFASHTVN